VVGTAAGLIPGTAAYVWLGTLATTAAEIAAGRRAPPGVVGQVLLWLGVAATAAVTWLVTRAARRALARVVEPAGAGPTPRAE
jgi:uncharacterized membrane protein YdjX (TVP38/TMEM64 family)